MAYQERDAPDDRTTNKRPRKRNEHRQSAPKQQNVPLPKIVIPKGCDSGAAMFYSMRRSRIPQNDPFSLVSDFLFHRLAGGQLYITVKAQEIGTFSSDNWSWFGAFLGKVRIAMDESPWPLCAVSLAVRRFEVGPKEPISGLLYKTIAGLSFVVPPRLPPAAGYWIDTGEENMKKAHRTDADTGRPIDAEPACLFSSFFAMFPEAKFVFRLLEV
jgi:hypothetical protein